ncbi:hypothetical protein MRB53_039117 [Persea americana]|nr:hypothetical protein MRB53_039117 [Persea americana]
MTGSYMVVRSKPSDAMIRSPRILVSSRLMLRCQLWTSTILHWGDHLTLPRFRERQSQAIRRFTRSADDWA